MADESSRHGGDQHLGQVPPVIEVFDDLLKDKGDGRQWCIEGRGQSCSGPGKERRAPALFGNPKPASNVRGESPGNMNRRTFSPKTATTPDRDRAGKEFPDHDLGRHESKIPPERDFRLGNTA